MQEGPQVFCSPTTRFDFFIFLVLNYFAHAATIIPIPGEKLNSHIGGILAALLCPYVGIGRGIESIARHAITRQNTPLQMAAQAGALCVVVRASDWRPIAGQEIMRFVRFTPPAEEPTVESNSHMQTPQR